jgi:hypothetical protein
MESLIFFICWAFVAWLFLCILRAVNKRTLKINVSTKLKIEIFWSFIVGILFSMAPFMFNAETFKLRRWWNHFSNTDGRFYRQDEIHLFLIGFFSFNVSDLQH